MFPKTKIYFSFVAFFLIGCTSTTGVLSKGDGVSTINVNNGNLSKIKAKAYQLAEKKCSGDSGKSMLVVREEYNRDTYSFDLDFKCQEKTK